MSKPKVWVLMAGYDYEESRVVAVFDNESEAKALESRYDNTAENDKWYNFVEVHEAIVGEMKEELFIKEGD